MIWLESVDKPPARNPVQTTVGPPNKQTPASKKFSGGSPGRCYGLDVGRPHGADRTTKFRGQVLRIGCDELAASKSRSWEVRGNARQLKGSDEV